MMTKLSVHCILNLRNVYALGKHYKEFYFSGCLRVLVLQEIFDLSIFWRFLWSACAIYII